MFSFPPRQNGYFSLSPSHGRLRHTRYSMSFFLDQISALAPTAEEIPRLRPVYLPYDRFTDRVGPLASLAPQETLLLIVESTAKAHRRPYHKKKLILLISNMRHFALEQAARGVRVLYHLSPLSHGQALRQLQSELRLAPILVPEPAERELRLDMATAERQGLQLEMIPDATWLSLPEDFLAVYGPFCPSEPHAAGHTRNYVMDRFYRFMRRKTCILMEAGKPVGGQFSFDVDNRKPWRGQPRVPTPPQFPPDAITREVIDWVELQYGHHIGSSENFDLPVTQADCDRLWSFALEHLLPIFGPYEDAMRDDELRLFHSKASPLINLGRLLPAHLIADVAAAWCAGRIPLSSAEGFIRQLLGWREFLRHLHRETDGYRLVSVPQEPSRKTHAADPPPDNDPPLDNPADPPLSDPLIGARPSALGAVRPLPAAYWGATSGLHCLDTVVRQVLDEGWSHHITRLMVLSNLATLCGFSPRELTDWFWIAYIDAYDWVVEPNVLGMATYADGGLTATKPYVSGAAYIHRMSNYCGHCQFNPKQSTGPGSCPFTALYWTFLERNESILASNPRLLMPYKTLRRKSESELVQLRARAQQAVDELELLDMPHRSQDLFTRPGPPSE